MKLTDFDYPISPDQIAQHPLTDRDSSNMLVINRHSGCFEHRVFKDVIDYLKPGDVLVLNNTKVIPVRLCGKKPTGGSAEITLLKELKPNVWEALVKGVHEGRIDFEYGISAEVLRREGTLTNVTFTLQSGADIKDFLHKIGVMPLPVYIKRKSAPSDLKQYQTVYAEKEGAIAAPTAGLHFTEALLNRIKDKGVEIRTVILHVGYGTFRAVTVEKIKDHAMEKEFYEIPEATARAINAARERGSNVIAVGTTVTRALESSAEEGPSGKVKPGRGMASMFIYPGYEFKVINALITNFHLPKSTPMMLASAFSGLDLLKKAYHEARAMNYRFFSYGDGMMIL